MKELDRGIERCNDFERTSALFGNLAMDGVEGLLPGFEPATRKKEPELVDDACHPGLFVEDHRIGRQSPLIGSSTLAVAKAPHGCHPARTVLRRTRFAKPWDGVLSLLHNCYIKYI